MNVVFADAFYWVALTNLQDSAHEQAKSLTVSLRPRTIFTTEEILTEYLNYFAGWGSHFRQKAETNIQSILLSQTVRTMPQTNNSFLSGLDLYRAKLDKGYSLTDCVSMQTMRRERVTEVLTNDLHFEQEGFQALFRCS
jgi:uncharacterized protein